MQVHVIAPRNDINDPIFIGFALKLHAFTAQIVDTSAFFFFRRVSRIKNNPVTAFDRCLNFADNAVTQHLLHSSYIYTTTLRKGSFNKLLVIGPVQKSMRKATRKALLQLTNFFLRRTCFISIKILINRLAIFTNNICYILRTFQAAFYFKRGYPRLYQLRHNIDSCQILRR
ncbi:hypothetical protein D3C73_1232140 [compost metagenome]